MKNFKTKLFFISIVVIILDQITKYYVTKIKQPITIIPNFLNIIFAKNTGASFGIFSGNNTILIAVTTLVMTAVIYYYFKQKENTKLPYIALQLVIGGGIGNLIDRIHHGFVVDFISFSFWPAFNLADSFITIGIALLIWNMIKSN